MTRRSVDRDPRRRTRFLPPMAGGEKKTGWEALEKWVGGNASSSASAGAESAATGGAKKTGWEALEQHVASPGSAPAAAAAPAEGGAKKTGWEALEKHVAGAGAATAAGAGKAVDKTGEAARDVKEAAGKAVDKGEEAASGFWAWLRKLFGGK